MSEAHQRPRHAIRNPRDLVSGVAVIVLALMVLAGLSRITVASYAAFSPALFPRVCSYLLLAGGAVLILRGFVRDGPPIDRLALPPLVLVTAAVALFGIVTPLAGYAPAGALTVLVSSLAARDQRLRQTLLSVAILTVGSVVLFSFVLKLSIPILAIPGLLVWQP
jgi:hypothetical protein